MRRSRSTITPGVTLVATGVVTAATGLLGFPTDLLVLLPVGLVQVGFGVAIRSRTSVRSGLLASVAALPSVLTGAALLTGFPLFWASLTVTGLGPVVAGMVLAAGAATVAVTLLTLAQSSLDSEA